MSKLSDTGLILLIIGTFLIVLSMILNLFEISPNLFLIIQINGWILFCIASIFMIITKDVYHIIKLKNNFPLKLDHLIIFICAMTIMITGLLLVDINSYKYTGKFTYFTIVYPLYIIFFAILIKRFNIFKNKKPN
ncbi:MAG: hypothetical protein CEE42_13660 [Promethearchaeota archaeon Loki_b31]|nr:MAG: hypothetical protein CEE42_13660 [Candidatus Lokiarchaeota archaeon Loki_b31]